MLHRRQVAPLQPHKSQPHKLLPQMMGIGLFKDESQRQAA